MLNKVNFYERMLIMRNLPYHKVKVLVPVLLLVIALSPCLLFAAAEDTNKAQVLTAVQSPLPATVAVAAAEDVNKAEVLTAAQMKMQLKMQQLVSVDFRETPIDDVLRMLAKQADIDIVKSPAVIGNVTATLKNVPLSEALDNILAANGYGYVATEHMIRVMSQKDIIDIREKFVNKIYRINYADITQVEAALKKFISKDGSLSANPGTSNIIVTDTESKITAIDAFIKEIDRITPQILVEARIYDITHQDTLDLGVEWQAGRNTTFTSGGNPAYGTDGITALGENPTGKVYPFNTGAFTSTTSKTQSTTGVLRLGWLNSGIDIDVLLKAQKEKINAKLLANPRILVLDNENAIFDIVREIPYKETSTTGNTATETILFKNVGVTLTVKPHLTRDGMLRLDIVPKFGVVVSTDPATHVPTVDTRSVKTIVLVKDGQTVVLGGLRKKDVAQQTNKIPLLGDLPLVGMAFRSEGEDTTTSEIIVFITPRLIESSVLTGIEENAYKATEFPLLKVQDSRAEKDAEKQK
jgi:type IV pilus assembly protein PilQ